MKFIFTCNKNCRLYAFALLLFVSSNAAAQKPVITSISPSNGAPYSSVTITGTGFSSTSANNVVKFGNTRATVTSASSTALTVTVPVCANYAPITVQRTSSGLHGVSSYPFLPTFATSSFFPGIIHFVDGGMKNPEGATPWSQRTMVMADLNGDSKNDLVTALDKGYSGDPDFRGFRAYYMYPYSDQSTFSDPYMPNVSCVAAGDLDGDGKPEVIVGGVRERYVEVDEDLGGYTEEFGSFTVWRNVTSSTAAAPNFVWGNDFSAWDRVTGLAMGDMNGDGKLDIVHLERWDQKVGVHLNTSTPGNIQMDVSIGMDCFSPEDVAVADLNSDGKPEIIVTSHAAGKVIIFRNTTTPISICSFAAQVINCEVGVTGLATGDLDGDGKIDFVIANQITNKVEVFHNDGTSGEAFLFTMSSYARTAPSSVAIGDMDGDAKPDVAVGSYDANSIHCLRNISVSGTILLDNATTYSSGSNKPHALAIGDLDMDQRPEIVSHGDHNVAAGYYSLKFFRSNPPSYITGGGAPICGGASVALGNSISGGWWVSGNPSVASVGLWGSVTGHSLGTSVISYQLPGGNVTTVVTVNLLPAEAGTISGPATQCVGVPTSYTAVGSLCMSCSSDTWVSSNTTVATVSAGVATGLTPGTATIYHILTNSCKADTATKVITVSPLPTLSSISATSGIPGATVTISGSNFDTIASYNSVYFGAAKAVVASASSGSLSVVVPNGATYGPITVTTGSCRRTSASGSMFMPDFDNSGFLSGMVNFDPYLESAVGSLPYAVIAYDFNGNDGTPELINTNAGGGSITISLNYNDTANHVIAFSPMHTQSTGATPGGIAAGDLDGDGISDLVVANRGSNNVSVFRKPNITAASFAPKVDLATSNSPTNVSLADIDGDGRMDIVVSCYSSGTFSVLLNRSVPGTISFAAKVDIPTGASPQGIAAGDFDGDGKPDIVISYVSTANQVSVFRNIATLGGTISAASFIRTDFAVSGSSQRVRVGDLNNDGKLDIAAPIPATGKVALLRNISTGSGTIAFATAVDVASASGSLDLAIGDLNGDGFPDMAVTSSDSVSVLRNTGATGSFTATSFAKTNFKVAANPWGVAIADLNVDNMPDIATVSITGSLSILRNRPVSPIVGDSVVCKPRTITLSNATAYGKWTSSNTSVATVGSATGIVTPISGGTATIKYTVAGGFVTKVVTVTAAAPNISSVSPAKGNPGTSLMLAGNSFSADASKDAVYFGAIKAIINSATTSSLNVTIPSGATYNTVTVTNLLCNELGASRVPFIPTYNNSAYLNHMVNMAGHVDFTTTGSPNYISIADFNNDGKSDVVVSGSSALSFFKNTGSGSVGAGLFGPGSNWGSANETAIADIDRDGRLDVVVANPYSFSAISILRNISTTDSIFFEHTGLEFTNDGPIAVGDIDRDGRPDILTGGTTLRVIKNLSEADTIKLSDFSATEYGVLAPVTSLDVADVDRDGKKDVVVGYASIDKISVFRNIAPSGVIDTAAFAPRVDITVGHMSRVKTVDIDGDGKLDILLLPQNGYAYNYVSVLRNISTSGSISSSSFEAPVNFVTDFAPRTSAIGDVNGDGKPDIVFSYQFSDTVTVLRNKATSGTIDTGSFGAKQSFSLGSPSFAGVALADMNGDGRPEILATSSSKFTVLKNDPLGPITGTFTVCASYQTGLDEVASNGYWSSSNTSVATVGSSNGTVTGLSAGTTTISYTAAGGTATAVVTVMGAPAISVVSPLAGNQGSAVTITGSRFNSVASGNIVYFGATKATVTGAASNSLSVTLPAGATYMPVAVANTAACGLMSYAKYPYLPTFDNSAYISSGVNFGARTEFPVADLLKGVAIGDIDGDGKPDLVVASKNEDEVLVYRNISATGSISSGSFAAPEAFRTGNDPYQVAIGDVNGDGKPELVVSCYGSNSVSVLRNNSSVGSVSFASKSDYSTGFHPVGVTIRDVNMDGKPDIAVACEGNQASILRNTMSATTFNSGSFTSTSLSTGTSTVPKGIAVADLDDDGKPEIVTSNSGTNNVSVFRNISTAGTFSSGSFGAAVNFAAGTTPEGISISDIDGDNKLDIVVANTGSASVSVLRNTTAAGTISSGSFAAKTDFTVGANPYYISIGDINGDSKPDIAVANSTSGTVSILRNSAVPGGLSAASFATKVDLSTGTGSAPYGVAVGDLDSDGKPDMVVTASGDSSVAVFRNDPLGNITGTFTVCPGSTSTLNEIATSGTWGSSNTAIATINSAGVVTGVSGGTATISYTGLGGNAIAVVTVSNPPTITSVSPLLANTGSSVIISGTNFDPVPSNNIVYFGATKAIVVSAGSNSLTATVPASATFMPVSVDNIGGCNLMAYAQYAFLPTFSNTSYFPGVINFSGHTTFTVGSNPYGAVVADIDGDGKPDVLTANFSTDNISVFRNTSTSGSIASGTFASKVDFPSGNGPNSIAAGDVDGDGKIDIVVTSELSDDVSVFRNTSVAGTITFAARVDLNTSNAPYGVALRDIDGDGRPDIVSGQSSSSVLNVFRNTGRPGSISFATRINLSTDGGARSIAIGDLDGDGKPDIATANYNGNTVSILRNTATPGTISSGSFGSRVDLSVNTQPTGIAIADIDGDGKADIAVSNSASGNISLLRNLSTPGSITTSSFATKVNFNTGTNPYFIAVGDLDGDGKADLAVPNAGSGNVSAFRNAGISGTINTGSLAAKKDFATGTGPQAAMIADIDGDGKPEVVVANSATNTISVLQNDLPGLIAGPDSVCTTASVTLTNATNGGTWSSSTTAVATVGSSSGIVTGVAGGTVTISYNLPGGSATKVVTVNTPPVVGTVSGFAMVCPGGTTTLAASGMPGYNWSSGNTSFATVNGSGVVSGVAVGTVAISYSGTNICGTSVASTIVTVNLPPVAGTVTGTTAPICLNATTTLSTTGTDGSWVSGNTSVATVGSASGIVTATGGGVSTISYHVVNGCGTSTATFAVAVNGVPVISTMSPSKGNNGSSVVLGGSSFNTASSSNIVYFGATKATVTAATFASLTVTVPTGATFMPVTVNNTGCNLVGYSQNAFVPTFDTSAYTSGTLNFLSPTAFSTGAASDPVGVAIGDLDGDGKADMVVADSAIDKISVFRNTSSAGTISSSSFATKVDFTTGSQPSDVALGDLDRDGKLDIVVTNKVSNTVSVFYNTSSSGSITSGSLAAKVDFATATSPKGVTVGDIDNDGKPEIIVANTGSGSVSVLRNTSTTGTMSSGSFAAKVDLTAGSSPYAVAIADVDGDGKQDIAVSNRNSNTISVFRNASTAGTISSGSFASKVDFSIGSDLRGMALYDVDGDNKPEMVVVSDNNRDIVVRRNTAASGAINSGSFAAEVEFSIYNGGTPNYQGMAVGDLNGDGRADIVVADLGADRVRVLRNTSTTGTINSASFSSVASISVGTGTEPMAAAIGDLDGDGKPEIIVANSNAGTVSVLRNDPPGPITGTFTLCPSATTTLGNIAAGGTWSSNATSVATVSSSTGILTGISGGTATISYNLDAGSVTKVVTVTSAPAISSVSPMSGHPGAAVTISGSNFGTSAANNIVYFGATRATVSSATESELGVTVPIDATYMNVSVDNTGCGSRTGYSQYPFLPTFDNSGYVTTVFNYSSFNLATGSSPASGTLADLDGDGKSDLIVANLGPNTVSVYRNISTSGSLTSGSFAAKVDFSVGSDPEKVVAGDIDGDGKIDLVTSNSGDATVTVLRNTSTSGTITAGSFATGVAFSTMAEPRGVAIGDIDGDGRPELAVACYTVDTVVVLQNRSTPGSITTSSFSSYDGFPVNAGPISVAIGDIDGDGKKDVVVGNSPSSSVSVLHNVSVANSITSASLATKVDFNTGSSPSDVAIGDIDGDGKADIVVPSAVGDYVSVLRNTATSGSVTSGSFATRVNFATGNSPRSVAIADMNGDGKPDIMTANEITDNVSVLRNTSTSGAITTGSFATKQDFAAGNGAQSVCAGDIDGDGKPDMAVVNNNATTATIFRNNLPGEIVGSNTLCMGANITLTNVAIGGTWSSSNTAAATIGSATGIVTSVAIGTTTISYNLPGGRATMVLSVTAVPAITSVSPMQGNMGASVIISGSNFNSSATNEVVYFGATKAAITTAGSSSMTVTIPSGATYMPVSVNNIGCGSRTAYAQYSFLPTFDNSSFVPGIVNCGNKVDLTSGNNPDFVAIGDIDGDGKADMIVTNNTASSVSVYRNASSAGSIAAGSFASKVDFTVGTEPKGLAIGDVDGDGKLDLAVANKGSNSVSVFRNTSTAGTITAGSFAAKVDFATNASPQAVAFGDIDGDGRGDMAVANFGASDISVFRNTGSSGSITSGSFAAKVDFAVGAQPGESITIGDIDGDGKRDIATVASGDKVVLFLNTAASGSITTGSLASAVSLTTTASPGSLAVGDIDGDAKPDLAITATSSDKVSVFRNISTSGTLTTGSFATKVDFNTGATPRGIALGDINGDGKTDLIISNSGSNSVSVLRNTATVGAVTTGSFALKTDFTVASSPIGVAVGDLDGDGKADIIAANKSSNSVSVLRNDPLSPIAGAYSVCAGASTTLSDATAGGTWSSSNAAVATVGSTGIVNGVAAGNATITYTVNGGYTTAAVTVNALADAGTITGTFSVCPTAAITLATSGSGGAWTSSDPGVATIDAGGIVSGISSGTTVITYTATTVCNSLFTTQAVTVHPLPNAGAISGDITLCATTSTTLSTTGTGGLWSSSNVSVASVTSAGIVAGVAGGTAIISYFVTNTCGTQLASTAITVNPMPNVGVIAGDVTVCHGSSISLSTSGSDGVWSSSNDSVASVSSAGIVAGIMPGAAVISYTGANSCGTLSAVRSMTVNAVPNPGVISGVEDVCVGSVTALNTSGSGGVWLSSDTAVATVSTTGTVSGIAVGTAIISYTATTPCGTEVSTIEVHINPLPNAGTIAGTASICSSSLATLSTSGTAGAWSSTDESVATVSDSGIVAGVSVGTATISYLVTNSCGIQVATRIVTVNPLPDAGVISGASSVCVAATSTLTTTGSGGAWSSSNAAVASIGTLGVITGNTGGIATITYATANSCGAAMSLFEVTVNILPYSGSISGTAVICALESITLSTTGTNGEWNSSDAGVATVDSSGIVTGVSGGTASVSYVSTTACGSQVATHVVTVNPLASAGTLSGTSSVCVSASTLIATDGSGGIWSTSDSSIATIDTFGLVSGLAPGTVAVSYAATNSCGVNIATKNITVVPLPDAGIITDTAVCPLATMALHTTGSYGTWSSANDSIAMVDLAGNVTAIGIGTAVISYHSATACGSEVATTTLTVSPLPDAGTISGTLSVCPSSTATVSTDGSGGVWSVSDSAIATVADGVITGIAPGTTIVTYAASNMCGVNYAMAELTVNPIPTAGVISGTATVCPGGITVLSSTSSGGTWSSSSADVATVDESGLVIGTSMGTAVISYYVATACGSDLATTIVTVDPLPDPGTVSGASGICAGDTVILASTAFGGAWSSSNEAVATVTTSGEVVGISEGSVEITYTITNTCGTGTALKPMTVNPLPAPAAVSGPGEVCVSDSIMLISTVGGGFWASSDVIVASVSDSGQVNGLSHGVATISYVQAGSCGTHVAAKTVTVHAIPNAGTITGVSSVCPGSAITLTSSSGPGGSWASSHTAIASVGSTGVITGVAPGVATISYTMANYCGTGTVTKSVTVNTLPSAGTVSGPSTVEVGAAITLSGTITGGVWSTSNSNATVSSAGVVTGVSAGAVSVSYIVTNTCGVSAPAVKNIIVTVEESTVTGSLTVCVGSVSTLSAFPSGGTWTAANTRVSIGSSTGIVTGVSQGTVNITYNISGGTSVVTMTVNPIPAAIGGTLNVCAGLATTLSNTTSGGSWSSSVVSVAVIGSTGVVSGLTPGVSIISYVLGTGCAASAVLTVNAMPDTIVGASSVCVGASVTMTNTLSGGTWSSSNPTVANIVPGGVVTGMGVGTARITYTATGGCKATRMLTVYPNPPGVNGIATVCVGATTTFTNPTPGGSWSSGNTLVATVDATSGIISGISGGTAAISYTFGTGCYATRVVTVNNVPTPILGSLSVCAGSTTSLSNATTPGVSWTSHNTLTATINTSTGVATGISAGTVNITYTIGNGCQATAVLTVNPEPYGIGGTVWVCVGSTGNLVSLPGGTWTSSTPAVGTVSTAGVVTGISAGTTTITYTISGGCYSTQGVTINPTPSAISGTTAVCVGGSSTLSSTPTGSGWSWSSSLPSVATVNATTGVVTGVAAGVTSITYSRIGCKATALFSVNPLPADITGSMNICAGTVSTLSNATTGGTWVSTVPSIATIDSFTGIITAVTAGTTQISYTVGTGCYKTAIVTVNALPATISGVSPMCTGTSSTFTNATPGGTWSSSNASVASVTSVGLVSANTAGNATITYTTGAGCIATFAVSASASPAAIGGTKTVCVGSVTTLTNTVAGGSWISSDSTKGSINTATGILAGISSGTTMVTYTTGTGCAVTAVVTVNSSPSISGLLGICAGYTTTLSGSPAGGTWSTASSLATVNATTGVVTAGATTGTATITYSISGACQATVDATVNMAPSAISGAPTVCKDLTTTFTNTSPGGVWSSSNPTAATINATTGVITGVSAGYSSVITYSFGGTCWKVKAITVNAVPVPITGYPTACVGLITVFSDATTGGTWSSNDTTVAKVNVSSGLITGIAAGTANITYNRVGCTATRVVSVIPNAGTITGSLLMCASLQTTLSDAVAGGTWSSSNTAIATVGSTGIVTAGIYANVATISYNIGTYCRATAVVTVKAIPAVISGSSGLCIGSTAVYTNTTTGGTWSSSNSSLASVVSGSASTTATFAGNSSGTVILSYTNAPSCARTLTVNVGACRAADGATSFENVMNTAVLGLYPNPTAGDITANTIISGTLFLYALDGREVRQYALKKGETTIALPNELAKGIYMCRFNGEDGSTVMVRLVVE
jgi:uncharacterized protein YjdB